MQRVLIITGASRGIGFATAELFLAEGYRVCNLSRTPAPLAGVANIALDLTRTDWEKTHGAELIAAIRDADQVALVHNAGAISKDSLIEFDADTFRRVMEVNVTGPARLTHLLLPHMRAGSSVTYIGSTLAEMAVPGSLAYVTSKHALIGLMRSTCQDLAGSGIHTTCVCPGFTDTDMLRTHVGGSPEVLAAIASGVTANRLIAPGEIARTILFCAREPVLNGSVIHANLGQINR
jgi:NAD(P)-dependent dehydrogenase (short-subunit alcohol dehydrogenase family)